MLTLVLVAEAIFLFVLFLTGRRNVCQLTGFVVRFVRVLMYTFVCVHHRYEILRCAVLLRGIQTPCVQARVLTTTGCCSPSCCSSPSALLSTAPSCSPASNSGVLAFRAQEIHCASRLPCGQHRADGPRRSNQTFYRFCLCTFIAPLRRGRVTSNSSLSFLVKGFSRGACDTYLVPYTEMEPTPSCERMSSAYKKPLRGSHLCDTSSQVM